MLALVGANGAGKSTLVKIICGAYTADDGVISVDGASVELRSIGDALAAGIAVAHQQIAVIPSLTAAENVMLGREPVQAGFIRNASLYQSAREILVRFGIDIPLDRDCEELDEGENKIIDILKALQNEPAILILDEPTASLTLAESRKLFAFLRGLKADGMAILFISHHLGEVFAECDRVVVLKDGRKVHESLVAATTPEAVVQAMVGRAITDTTWSSNADGAPTTILRDAVIARAARAGTHDRARRNRWHRGRGRRRADTADGNACRSRRQIRSARDRRQWQARLPAVGRRRDRPRRVSGGRTKDEEGPVSRALHRRESVEPLRCACSAAPASSRDQQTRGAGAATRSRVSPSSAAVPIRTFWSCQAVTSRRSRSRDGCFGWPRATRH